MEVREVMDTGRVSIRVAPFGMSSQLGLPGPHLIDLVCI